MAELSDRQYRLMLEALGYYAGGLLMQALVEPNPVNANALQNKKLEVDEVAGKLHAGISAVLTVPVQEESDERD